MSFVASARSTTPSWLDDKKTFREKAPFATTRWAALEHVEAAGRRDTTSTNVAEWSNEKMKSLLNWTKHKKKNIQERSVNMCESSQLMSWQAEIKY